MILTGKEGVNDKRKFRMPDKVLAAGEKTGMA
jgi:hypothetical protein